METKAYLERIGYRGSTRPSLSVLRKLHRRHLLSIPFENLDIHLHRPIYLERGCFLQQDHQASPRRILLRIERLVRYSTEETGFQSVNAISACREKRWRVHSRLRSYDIVVQLKDLWLADVGFGDSFTEPKRLGISSRQPDHGRDYRLIGKGGWTLLSRRNEENGRWEHQYKFGPRPRKLSEFAPRCVWQQTSPRSHFKKGRVCTRLTSNGRLTLTDTRFIVTRGSRKVERPLKNPEEFTALLHRHFGIDLN